MTVAIPCSECSEDVVFLIDGEKKNPREMCECGAVYELRAKRVVP